MTSCHDQRGRAHRDQVAATSPLFSFRKCPVVFNARGDPGVRELQAACHCEVLVQSSFSYFSLPGCISIGSVFMKYSMKLTTMMGTTCCLLSFALERNTDGVAPQSF